MRAAISSGVVLLTVSLASAAVAQNAAPALRVATFVLPPYVMAEGDHLTGFSIDLWNAVAARLKVDTDYQRVADVAALLDDVRSDKADVGVSGVFITAEREQYADFSVSVLNAGMQVMVRASGSSGTGNALTELLGLLFSRTALIWLGIAVLFMLIPAHLVWFLERRQKDGIIPDGRYLPGVFHAMHWSATTLLTQAEQTPRNPLARIISFIWMFVAVVFVALYTAQLTASLTVEQIRGAINGPDDLPGKTVATLAASTSADYLRGRDVQLREFPETDQMLNALLRNEVDAVLFSAPTLHYYASHMGAGKVKLVGPEFRKLDIGFVVPVHSPHRREINAALLALRDNGTYEQLYNKWFGSE